MSETQEALQAEMEEPPPSNLVEALARIMGKLPAIAKVKHPTPDGKGVTYAYRGIEEITAEAQGLFARYGVVIVPRVQSREVQEITVNSNPWTDTYLEVAWTIYGPGGLQDSFDAQTFGHGRDNSDKGTNKAMTQAFKYLLLDMLMISDPSDDNDGTNIASDAGTTSQPTHVSQRSTQPSNAPSEAQMKALAKIHETRKTDLQAASIARWGKSPDKLIKQEVSRWLDELNGKVKPPEPDAEGRPF